MTLAWLILGFAAGAEELRQISDASNPDAGKADASFDEVRRFGGSLLLKATPGCSGGIVYDDGTFENAVQPVISLRSNGVLLMRFDPPADAIGFDQVCLCWTQVGGVDTVIIHDVVMYAADGVNGGPGTILEERNFVTENIPLSPSTGIYQYDLTNGGFQLPSPGASVYLGVGGFRRSINSSIFLCADNDGGGTQPMFGSGRRSLVPIDPEVDALGIRADAILEDDQPPTGGCVPSDTTLCIDDQPGDSRFEIRLLVDTAAGGGLIRQSETVELGSLGIARGGILHFGNARNPEVLVKILNGCSVNGKYWVFAAAATNLGFTMTVTDTQVGASKTYSNPDFTQALAVTDTQAFDTCSATAP